MQGSFVFPVFLSLQYAFVYSAIPSLVVKKIDRTLIEKKRQDTMDMCRIFTEENERSQNGDPPKIINSYAPIPKHRSKRDLMDETQVKGENRRYKRNKRDIGDGPDYEKMKIDQKEIHRVKRATMKYAVNPALDPTDTRRVENIVDKLYDDMEEKGQRVTYRQVQTPVSFKLPRNKTVPSRRFDFAPASLTYGTVELKVPPNPEDIPFISKARWRRGIVPYFIDPKTYDAHLSEAITVAFDYVEKATCIRLQRLREKPIDKLSLEVSPWVYITNPTGIRQCVHSNEKRRINGVHMTVFGYDCMSMGDIVHEVMHILGYSHEHLRSDRDQYVSVLWDNIKPGYKKYFDLNIEGSEYELETLPYDYASILHYPPRAFSKNGKVTLLTEPGIKIGQRDGLSEIDVEKISLIYSNECVSRNKEYLLETCPRVVKSVIEPSNVTQQEVTNYFKDRLWPYGIINYRFRDKMEFSIEERENIKAVFTHIQKETCLQFRNVASDDEEQGEDEDYGDSDNNRKRKDSSTESSISIPKQDTTLPDQTEDKDQNIEEENTEKPVVVIEKIDKIEITTTLDHQDQQTNTDPQDTQTTLEPLDPQQTTEQPGIESDQGQDKSIESDQVQQTTDSVEKILGSGEKATIVITQSQKLRRSSNIDIRDNEISDEKNNIFGGNNNFSNIKNMSLTMKNALLRRAKQRKGNTRRRRDTLESQTRRHANAILVLRRTPDTTCQCPKPGTPSGDKMLDISAGCFNSVNDLLHFFVHLLGLDHQHNMHDRDNYLHIVWENLAPDVVQELKNKLPPAASVGFPYDYQSVMHFPWLQIKNGKSNIMYPIWNDGWAMGHWQGLSSVDVQKLDRLYIDQCMERRKQEKNS